MYIHCGKDKQQPLQTKVGDVSMDIKRSYTAECHALHQPGFESWETTPEDDSIGLGQQLRVLSR